MHEAVLLAEASVAEGPATDFFHSVERRVYIPLICLAFSTKTSACRIEA